MKGGVVQFRQKNQVKDFHSGTEGLICWDASQMITCHPKKIPKFLLKGGVVQFCRLMELGSCRLYVGCCCCRLWFMDFTPLFEVFTDLLSIHLTTDRGWEEIGHRGPLMVPGEDFE